MKNIKKFVATLGLMGYIIMTASTANAGIIMADRATPTNPTVIERVLNSVRNVVIGQITGVTVQSEGIIMADRAGIIMAD